MALASAKLSTAPIAPLVTTLEHCSQTLFRNPRRCALYLDMDGTLLRLAVTPKSVSVPSTLLPLLERLSKGLDGAVAIVTGRRIVEVDRILAPLHLAASGVHGAELRFSPESDVLQQSATLADETVEELRALAALTPGAIVEPKGSGLAIHYRLVPKAEPELRAALERFIARNPGAFDLWPGQKVFEVIPAGFSKGTAISAFAGTPVFGDRCPVMIGDDVGDEPAFAAARRLGGFGLRVCGEHNQPDVADFSGPDHVLAWLEDLAQRLERDPGPKLHPASRHIADAR